MMVQQSLGQEVDAVMMTLNARRLQQHIVQKVEAQRAKQESHRLHVPEAEAVMLMLQSNQLLHHPLVLKAENVVLQGLHHLQHGLVQKVEAEKAEKENHRLLI
jgi:hypothetical protein